MVTETQSAPVSFTITAEDYTYALRLHMRRYWATRTGPKLFLAAMFVLCAVAVIVSGFDRTPTTIAIIVLIGTAMMPLLSYFFVLPRQARKVYHEVETMRHPTTASWNLEGYSASSGKSSSTIAWSDYYGWSADEKMVLLMQAPNLFQMLPLHALSSDQVEDLMGHLEKVGLHRI